MVGEFPEDSFAHKNGELPSRANATNLFFLFKKYLFIWLSWVVVVAGGIQFPKQGLNLGPLHWEHRVSATGPRREVPHVTFPY